MLLILILNLILSSKSIPMSRKLEYFGIWVLFSEYKDISDLLIDI